MSTTDNELLHSAIFNDDHETVTKLLTQGFDINVNVKKLHGIPALHYAILKKKKKIFKLLLNACKDLNSQNYYGCKLFHFLIKHIKSFEWQDIIIEMINRGADINAGGQFEESPLHTTIAEENEAMFKIFLNNGINLNSKDVYGHTPLHYLANSLKNSRKHLYLASTLLDRGAEVDSKDFQDQTPLYLAASNGKNELVDLFLKNKADVSVLTKNGQPILMKAIEKKGNLEIIQTLINHGADVNHLRKDNVTPLNLACFNKGAEIVKCLLKNGSNPNTPTRYKGFSILMQYARFKKHLNSEKIKLLLKYGADVNYVTPDKDHVLSSPLQESSWKIILKHIAKLQALSFSIHSCLIEVISGNNDYKNYFNKCTHELIEDKNTKLLNSWVTFFNLLVDSKFKLRNYSGNEALVSDFRKIDLKNKFPVYGAIIQKRFLKGSSNRKKWDVGAEILGNHLPIFNPTHLVIRNILDLLPIKDLEILCEQ